MHGFVYDPATGQAQRLNIDFAAYINDLRQVYELYSKPEPSEGGEEVGKVLGSGDSKDLVDAGVDSPWWKLW